MSTSMKVYVYMEYDFDMTTYEKKWHPNIRTWKAGESEERLFLYEMEIPVDIPKDFDGTARAVLALRKEREKVVAQFTAALHVIDEKIANLQAIGYDEK